MDSPVLYFKRILGEFDIQNGYIDEVWWERSQLFKEEDGSYSGRIDLGFRLKGISGGNYQFSVPIFIQKGKIIDPSLIFYNNQPLVLNQTVLNKFLQSSIFYDIPEGSWMDVEGEFFYLKQPRDNRLFNDRYYSLIYECLKVDGQPFRDFLSGKPVIKKLSKFKKEGQLLDAIFAAIEHRRLMKFYYVNKKGESGYRVVEPHYIWETKDGNWLLIAWDRNKNNWRSFYLDEMDDVRIKIRNRFEPYDKFLGRVTLYRMTKEKIPASEGDFFTERGPIHPRTITKVRGDRDKIVSNVIDWSDYNIQEGMEIIDLDGYLWQIVGLSDKEVELIREDGVYFRQDAGTFLNALLEKGIYTIVGKKSKKIGIDELEQRFRIIDEFNEYGVEVPAYGLWDDTLRMMYDYWVSQGKPENVVFTWDYIDRSSHVPINLGLKPKGEWQEVGKRVSKEKVKFKVNLDTYSGRDFYTWAYTDRQAIAFVVQQIFKDEGNFVFVEYGDFDKIRYYNPGEERVAISVVLDAYDSGRKDLVRVEELSEYEEKQLKLFNRTVSEKFSKRQVEDIKNVFEILIENIVEEVETGETDKNYLFSKYLDKFDFYVGDKGGYTSDELAMIEDYRNKLINFITREDILDKKIQKRKLI